MMRCVLCGTTPLPFGFRLSRCAYFSGRLSYGGAAYSVHPAAVMHVRYKFCLSAILPATCKKTRPAFVARLLLFGTTISEFAIMLFEYIVQFAPSIER